MKQKIMMLSLWQPWASLCLWKNPDGKAEKQMETRHWSRDYRGLIAIHATAVLTPEAKFEIETNTEIQKAMLRHGFTDHQSFIAGKFRCGAILGVVTLENIVQFDTKETFISLFPERERQFGNHSPGRFGWHFTNPIEFKTPIKCRGLQSLGTPNPEIQKQIFEQLELMK